MSVFLLIVCYLIFLIGAFLLFNKIAGILHLESQKKARQKDMGEALQSVISGFILILAAVFISLFYSVFIFASLLGIFLMFSGSRYIRKKSKSKPVFKFVKEIRTTLAVILAGQLLMGAVLVNNMDSEELVSTRQVKTRSKGDKVKGTRYVVKRSYAREGASSRNEILGICSPGTKVKLIRKKNGFYYVKGSYHKGTEGQGKEKSGKFWIGGSLLRETPIASKNTAGKKSPRKGLTGSDKNSREKRKTKSWPSFD